MGTIYFRKDDKTLHCFDTLGASGLGKSGILFEHEDLGEINTTQGVRYCDKFIFGDLMFFIDTPCADHTLHNVQEREEVVSKELMTIIKQLGC